VSLGRRTWVVATALGCAVALAACGGSSSSSKSAAKNAVLADALKFSNCMRAHGVPNFPDPVGGGFSFPIGSGFNPFAPGVKAAQHACRGFMPGGGPPPEASAQDKERLVRLAACMRAHGVTGFPDPVSSPPASPAGYSIFFGQPGAFLAVPSTINVHSPAFQSAGKACGFPGFGRGVHAHA
jgi:hypothetical protein